MKRLFLAAVSAALVVGSASAADLQARVPFQFTAAGKVMPPGNYRVTFDQNGRSFHQIINVDSRHSVLVPTSVPLGRDGFATDPRFVFRCAGEFCTLSEVWMQSGHGARIARSKDLKEIEKIAAVRTEVVSAGAE